MARPISSSRAAEAPPLHGTGHEIGQPRSAGDAGAGSSESPSFTATRRRHADRLGRGLRQDRVGAGPISMLLLATSAEPSARMRTRPRRGAAHRIGAGGQPQPISCLPSRIERGAGRACDQPKAFGARGEGLAQTAGSTRLSCAWDPARHS